MNLYLAFAVAFVVVFVILPSINVIGATEVGLVMKRFGLKKLRDDNAITQMAERQLKFVPEIMVSGEGGGVADGLAAMLMRSLGGKRPASKPATA